MTFSDALLTLLLCVCQLTLLLLGVIGVVTFSSSLLSTYCSANETKEQYALSGGGVEGWNKDFWLLL